MSGDASRLDPPRACLLVAAMSAVAWTALLLAAAWWLV
jgi:hypothetical protein